jgi:hypothetical protein
MKEDQEPMFVYWKGKIPKEIRAIRLIISISSYHPRSGALNLPLINTDGKSLPVLTGKGSPEGLCSGTPYTLKAEMRKARIVFSGPVLILSSVRNWKLMQYFEIMTLNVQSGKDIGEKINLARKSAEN